MPAATAQPDAYPFTAEPVAQWPHDAAVRDAASFAWKFQWTPAPVLIAEVQCMTGLSADRAERILRNIVCFREGLDGALAWAVSGECDWDAKIDLYKYERAFVAARAGQDHRVAA